MLALILILIGVFSRLIPHLPNFTPVATIALFSGAYLNNKRVSLLVPLTIMVISDFLIGLYDVVIFSWIGFILIGLLGKFLQKKKSISRIFFLSLASSFIFYFISNFGVWLVGWYPFNLKGLITCYIMGLPFLRNFILGNLLYTIIFFGIYETVFYLVKDKKIARILLIN